MPADLTELNGQHLVAVNVNRGHPWHMLGEMVDQDMTMEQALELVGVRDEEVRHKELFTVADGATRIKMTVHGETGDWIRVRHLEPVDNDVAVAINSTVFGTISTASNGYHPIQRRHLLQTAYDIVGLTDDEGKGYIDTIGNLGPHGDTFFAYIRVPDIVIDPNGIHDIIEHGLFVATSFNQVLANTIGYSPIRPVCRNTVTMALGNLSQTIKVRHTKNSEQRIHQAAVALEYAGAVEAEMVKRAEEMLKVDGEKAFQAIVDNFYNLDDESLSDKAQSQRTRIRTTIRRLYDGQDNTATRLVGENGWAAYQAFVEFKDHESNLKGKDQSITRARNAVLPGKTVNDKIKASELVLALAA
jgi:phage/plasmid-like protein (TIGR03299 family)